MNNTLIYFHSILRLLVALTIKSDFFFRTTSCFIPIPLSIAYRSRLISPLSPLLKCRLRSSLSFLTRPAVTRRKSLAINSFWHQLELRSSHYLRDKKERPGSKHSTLGAMKISRPTYPLDHDAPLFVSINLIPL